MLNRHLREAIARIRAVAWAFELDAAEVLLRGRLCQTALSTERSSAVLAACQQDRSELSSYQRQNFSLPSLGLKFRRLDPAQRALLLTSVKRSGRSSGPIGLASTILSRHATRSCSSGGQHCVSAGKAYSSSGPPDGPPSSSTGLSWDEVNPEGLGETLERALLEAYRLLGEGKVEQAEYLLAEGLKSAEPLLSSGNPLLAQLLDQLALLQHFQGRFREAERHALLSLELMLRLPAGPETAPAVALCRLRLGALLLGLERNAEAVALLDSAHGVLLAAFGEEYEPANEASYYLTFARLPKQLSAATLLSVEPRLLRALTSIAGSPGVGTHLLRAALREHRALIDRAVDVQDWELAEAILQQGIRIQEAVCPGSEELALTTYQYGTLQYVRGLYSQAEELCEASLSLSRTLYRRDTSSQVALRLHRMGTLRLAMGRSADAIRYLEQSCKTLARSAGESNPLTGEARAALALAKLGHLDESHAGADPYTRILNPGRRRVLLEEADVGLSFMERGFGRGHMLVRKMRELRTHVPGDAAGLS